MAQSIVNATVILGGQINESFAELGDQLLDMSMMVDKTSRKLIDFGKESVGVYRDYEDSLLDAEGALAKIYGKDTPELERVMKRLDLQIMSMAEYSMHHTTDFANAVSEMAHAGWDEEKIMEGLYASEKLAVAGSMDLSEALLYSIKTANALQIPQDELASFVDEWVYAANSVSADVKQYGEAMEGMNASMRLAENRREILALLGPLHDAGVTGAQAGVLLRNVLIRLVAPTMKAQDAMALLGVSEEQVNAAMEETGGDVKKATEILKEFGFSAYDHNEKRLKPLTQTFKDLATAIDEMDEEERNRVLYTIFPTRSFSGSLAILESAKNNYNDLYDAMERGEASGYGDYVSTIKMRGLTGALELFNSKVETTKVLTGKALEDDLIGLLSDGGQFIDKINGLDEQTFNVLVNGLTGIAGAGPLLSIAGWGFRSLSKILGTHTGRIALAATALFGFYKAAAAVAEYDYKNKFGNLSLNSEIIAGYLTEVSKPFEEAKGKLDAYNKSMNDAVSAYTSKSSELAQGIITKMVIGTELTDEEADSFIEMGKEIISSLREGMEAGYKARSESVYQTLNANGIDSEHPLFKEIMGTIDSGFEQSKSKAESLSRELRNALTSAFDDKNLTQEETQKIQSILGELNKSLSLATKAEMYAEEEKLLSQAQTLGIEGLEKFSAQVDESMNKVLLAKQEEQFKDLGWMLAMWESELGTIDDEGNVITEEYNRERRRQYIALQQNELDAVRAYYKGIEVEGYNYALLSNGYGEIANVIGYLVSNIRNGNVDAEALWQELGKSKYSPRYGENAGYRKFLEDTIKTWGGESTVKGMIRAWKNSGATDIAETAQSILDSWRFYTGDFSSFYNSSSYNFEEEERPRKTRTEKQNDARKLMDSVKLAEHGKLGVELDEALELKDVEIGFDYEENANEAKKELEEIFGKEINQSVVINVRDNTKQKTFGDLAGDIADGWNHLKKLIGFAEGGRSDVPAIFGEGDVPEWAIPEAHTPRTASLLTAAAEASGFSWPELATRSGGGGFNINGLSIHYSPVIHDAYNADGIERILKKDKENFLKTMDRWWEEKILQAEITSYDERNLGFLSRSW